MAGGCDEGGSGEWDSVAVDKRGGIENPLSKEMNTVENSVVIILIYYHKRCMILICGLYHAPLLHCYSIV